MGASGAIAGVMGAYFLLYPHSKILTLIPIFFLPYFIEIPAFFFLGLWFFLQFISAAGTPAQGGGIAWWAHIGGFVFGMGFLKVFLLAPDLGLSARIREKISKNKSHRLQLIRPRMGHGERHLYGTIMVTPQEARQGSKKLVSIRSDSGSRLIKVTVPPGSREGTTLRLTGAGRQLGDGTRGDLYLRLSIA